MCAWWKGTEGGGNQGPYTVHIYVCMCVCKSAGLRSVYEGEGGEGEVGGLGVREKVDTRGACVEVSA